MSQAVINQPQPEADLRTLGFSSSLTFTAQQEQGFKAVAGTWLLVPAGTTLSSCPWRCVGAKPLPSGNTGTKSKCGEWGTVERAATQYRGCEGHREAESGVLESKHCQLARVGSSLQPLGGLLGPCVLDNAQNIDAIGLRCAEVWGDKE